MRMGFFLFADDTARETVRMTSGSLGTI